MYGVRGVYGVFENDTVMDGKKKIRRRCNMK
jgi:hypothetical protein